MYLGGETHKAAVAGCGSNVNSPAAAFKERSSSVAAMAGLPRACGNRDPTNNKNMYSTAGARMVAATMCRQLCSVPFWLWHTAI